MRSSLGSDEVANQTSSDGSLFGTGIACPAATAGMHLKFPELWQADDPMISTGRKLRSEALALPRERQLLANLWKDGAGTTTFVRAVSVWS